jgi:DNA polymerase-3 subunit epsilon
MTRKQSTFNLSAGESTSGDANAIKRLDSNRKQLKIIIASADELTAHQERLAVVKKEGGEVIWGKNM